MRDGTDYYVNFTVSGGELYRVELSSVGVSGKIEMQLIGSYPKEGGTFRNLIPYLDDFSITAVPFSNETFLGWFDSDGNEVSEFTTVSRSENEIQYVLHNKNYSMKSFAISGDIYLYGKFNYYSMKIINPEGESGQFQYYGDLSVGSEIELRATPNGGFTFKEWMLYNPETGEIVSFRTDYRFETDLRTAADQLYSPEMNVYKFRMLETNLIFVVTWSTSNDGTYDATSYTKYDISYEDVFVNAPENRTVFYYTDPSSITEGRPHLTTAPFALVDPSRFETENGVNGYYIFEGWYYHDAGGQEISLYDSVKKQYIVDPAVAIGYAQNGKVNIYAKWGEPVPEVTIYVDETSGQEYVLLGEYRSSYVDPVRDSEEFASIRRVAGQDGYYYSTDGTKKYYKHAENMYFRVEKLRWDVIRKDSETILIQAHELFITSQYNDTTNFSDGIYANNWEHSYLRQYLNGEFMTTIFNTFEINLIMINSSTVNNKPVMGNPAFDDKNRYPWVAQSDTEDYIYIFSYAEITNIMNGFNTSSDAPCELRKADYTDYYDMILSAEARKGYYWLRSPGSNETNVFVVDENGRIVLDKNVSYAGYGIRPVIKLSAALVK